MIREFHDEIQRLREQLASMTGGKFKAKSAGGQINPATGQVEIENVIHVEDKEKMKAMEEELEGEKKAMMKEFEKQKARISAK